MSWRRTGHLVTLEELRELRKEVEKLKKDLASLRKTVTAGKTAPKATRRNAEKPAAKPGKTGTKKTAGKKK